MNINFGNEINVSEIEYGDVKPYGDHANIVYLKYKNAPIYIQTPEMKCPYGLSRFETDNGRFKYSLELSFGNKESDLINNLKTVLEKIDDKILTDSVTNSLKWFKKKSQSRDVAQALFSPSIKVATKDGETTDTYPPTFKLKVPFYNDQFKVECYSNDKEKLDSNDLSSYLTRGQMVCSIVKLGGIWFAGGKFGITWDVIQLKLNPTSNKINNKINDNLFRDDSDDEEKTEDDSPTSQKSIGEDTYIIDSEDDDL